MKIIFTNIDVFLYESVPEYKLFPMTLFSWDGEIDTLMSPRDSIIYCQFFINAGMMSIDPHNGHVKAYVGGINQKHFKWDNAMNSKRQVGSTFKPILYALAMQEGTSPCETFPTISPTIQVGEGETETTSESSRGTKGVVSSS